MQHFRLTYPDLDFWVDLRLHEALASLGTRLANELAESADLTDAHTTM